MKKNFQVQGKKDPTAPFGVDKYYLKFKNSKLNI